MIASVRLLPALEILGLALKPLELTLLPLPDVLRGPPVPPALLGADAHDARVDGAAHAVLQLSVELGELVGCKWKTTEVNKEDLRKAAKG